MMPGTRHGWGLARRAAALASMLFAANVLAAEAEDDLSRCREQRLSAPADALPLCENAAGQRWARRDFEAAFEAWMHAAELASQLGDRERAEAALQQAVPLLAEVHDPLAAQRLARRRGLNAYRDGRPVDALAHFLEALAAARASGDTQAIAISENDLGVTHRHLGNHAVALGHLESSLNLRTARGDSDLGALLANIGSLYLELGDFVSARRDLQRALVDHRGSGRELLAYRTIEELARLSEREGSPDDARSQLGLAWDYYSEVRAPRDQVRVALRLASLETEQQVPDRARIWLDEARRLAGVLDRHGLLQTELVAARLVQTDRDRQHAYLAISAALADSGDTAPVHGVAAHAALAELAEALGRPQQALAHFREFHDLDSSLQASRHGERLDALRVRFDVTRLEADRDRLASEAARQDAELARRRFETVLVAALALLALAVLALVSQSRLYRQRSRSNAERHALERGIAEARQAATLLRSDLRSTRWLLEPDHSAAFVFDAAGSIRAATASAAAAFDCTLSELEQRKLAQVVGESVADWAQALVETASLAGGGDGNSDLGVTELDDPHVRLHCRNLDLEEELGVLLVERMGDADGAFLPATLASEPSATEPMAAAGHDDSRHALRSSLVDLMQASVDAWERVTRKSRVELAEASRVWRITVDDGRLRVRALDRYLRADTLPARPRWREVLRTAYFVLAEVPLDAEQRRRMEGRVEALLNHVRERG